MSDIPEDLLSEDQLIKNKLVELSTILEEEKKREGKFDPITYGLPDLLRPQQEDETEHEFKQRQNRELKKFITTNLHIYKDGIASTVKVFPKIENIICDAFYRRENRLIIWKGRGCGGSVSVAVAVFLSMVYHGMSFINMSGSLVQAKAIFDHVCGFWSDFPEMKRALMKSGHPLKAEISLKNGVSLKAVPASEKQARHQHVPGMVIDEAAQPEGSEVGEIMQTALEGTMSEADHMILLVSTFHEPAGFFQEMWDHAHDRGFARYKFSILDAMKKCTAGIEEYATETDPLALKFCREQCPLTDKIEEADEFGNIIGTIYEGCSGEARKSAGFQTREQVITAKRVNVGTDKFLVEFICKRPKWKRSIYDAEAIEEQSIPTWNWEPGADAVVGIDWGFSIQSSCLLIVRGHCADDESKTGLGVIEADFMTKELVGGTILRLRRWHSEYGLNFKVYADAENPYNNHELELAGFEVEPVAFGSWKEFGIGNIARWLNRKKLFFIDDLRILLSQLKGYRRAQSGKPMKEKDHGPDALLAAMLHFPFLEEFSDEIDMNWTPMKHRRKETSGPDVFLI